MKYLLLIYGNPVTWAHPMFPHHREPLTREERDVPMHRFTALMNEIRESGELVADEALAAPETARTVRVRDDEEVITDGPFPESKEHLAGYLVIDCESEQRVLAIAARFSDTRYAAIEVRPIMDRAGLEM